MPRQINMFLSNGNYSSVKSVNLKQPNINSLASKFFIPPPKAQNALNSSIIARIHNVQPGCGSCGKH